MRDRACCALAVAIDCAVVDRRSRSQPARIAVFSRGGGSGHEHESRYAHSGASLAPAPGAPARRIGSAAGLNLLSFAGRRSNSPKTLSGVICLRQGLSPEV